MPLLRSPFRAKRANQIRWEMDALRKKQKTMGPTSRQRAIIVKARLKIASKKARIKELEANVHLQRARVIAARGLVFPLSYITSKWWMMWLRRADIQLESANETVNELTKYSTALNKAIAARIDLARKKIQEKINGKEEQRLRLVGVIQNTIQRHQNSLRKRMADLALRQTTPAARVRFAKIAALMGKAKDAEKIIMYDALLRRLLRQIAAGETSARINATLRLIDKV